MGNNINNNGNHDFKMKTAEFQGYTIKALEDLTKEICDLKIEIKETNNRLEKSASSPTFIFLYPICKHRSVFIKFKWLGQR